MDIYAVADRRRRPGHNACSNGASRRVLVAIYQLPPGQVAVPAWSFVVSQVELRADGWVEQEVAKWGNILVAGCMSWLAMNDGLLGGVVIVSGVISVVSFCLDVYVKYVILPEVEERLKNCRIVIDAKRCWDNAGFVGRRYRLVAVNLALTSTELMRQKSLVDIKDVASISSHQRRWICIPERVAITSFIAGITALAVLGKLW